MSKSAPSARLGSGSLKNALDVEGNLRTLALLTPPLQASPQAKGHGIQGAIRGELTNSYLASGEVQPRLRHHFRRQRQVLSVGRGSGARTWSPSVGESQCTDVTRLQALEAELARMVDPWSVPVGVMFLWCPGKIRLSQYVQGFDKALEIFAPTMWLFRSAFPVGGTGSGHHKLVLDGSNLAGSWRITNILMRGFRILHILRPDTKSVCFKEGWKLTQECSSADA